MRTLEEINGMFWHSIAASIHEGMARRWLPVAGIAKASGVPEKQVAALLSGTPTGREPRVSEIIAVMAVFKIYPQIDIDDIEDVRDIIERQDLERSSSQLSILDVIGQGWAPTEESSHDD